LKKGRLLTVFLVVLVDLIGFGIVLPLLPFYASEFGANPVAIGLLYSVFSFAQLIFSPLWGSLSDRIGRRPVMLLSTFGAVIAYIIFGLAGTLTVLFISRAVAGVMGGNIATAQAYIADVTTDADRAQGMGLIGAAFGIGFVMGPAIATGLIHPGFHELVAGAGFTAFAAWMGANTFALPGFFAAGLSLVSFIMVWFLLVETTGASAGLDVGAPSSMASAGAHASATNARFADEPGTRAAGPAAAGMAVPPHRRYSVFSPAFWRALAPADGRSGGFFGLLLLSIFLLSFGQASLYSAFPLFCEAELGMGPEQVGVQFFYIGLIAVIVQGGLMRYITRWFAEERVFLTGNILMTAGMALIAVSGSISVLTLFIGIMALGHSLNLPTVNSLVSKEADPARMGAMMGTAQGLSGLGRTIGPTWGGLLFGFGAGLPFILTSAILIITIWVGIRMWNRSAGRGSGGDPIPGDAGISARTN
jgi:MFS transporter, DHA1 family, tetracycline resistance protein